MICRRCKAAIPEDVVFCPFCGTPQEVAQEVAAEEAVTKALDNEPVEEAEVIAVEVPSQPAAAAPASAAEPAPAPAAEPVAEPAPAPAAEPVAQAAPAPAAESVAQAAPVQPTPAPNSIEEAMSDEDETAAPVDAPGADPAYTAAAVAAAAVNNQQQAQWQQQQAQQAQWQQQQAQQQAQWQQQQAWQQQQQQAQWQQQAYYQQPYAGPAPASPAEKSKVAAGLLGIFLGGLGIHKFYLGMTKPGLIMLLVTLIAGIITFGLAAVAMEVIGIIEGIMYLTKSDQEFYYTYVVGKKEWF